MLLDRVPLSFLCNMLMCRLGVDTFQGRLNIPLAEVRRRRHLKGDYQLEGVRQVGCLHIKVHCICRRRWCFSRRQSHDGMCHLKADHNEVNAASPTALEAGTGNCRPLSSDAACVAEWRFLLRGLPLVKHGASA